MLDVSNAGVAEVWRGRLTAPDALELSDASGATTQLVRESAVDAAFECVELQETRRFTGLPAPSSFSGLAFDGAQLWYSVGDALHAQPVDPGTGAAGTQIDLGPAWSHVRHGARIPAASIATLMVRPACGRGLAQAPQQASVCRAAWGPPGRLTRCSVEEILYLSTTPSSRAVAWR